MPIKRFGAVSRQYIGVQRLALPELSNSITYLDRSVHIGTPEVSQLAGSQGREGLRDHKQSGCCRSKSEKPKRTAQCSRLTLFDQRDTFVAVMVLYINMLGYLSPQEEEGSRLFLNIGNRLIGTLTLRVE